MKQQRFIAKDRSIGREKRQSDVFLFFFVHDYCQGYVRGTGLLTTFFRFQNKSPDESRKPFEKEPIRDIAGLLENAGVKVYL